jgi:UDP-glucose 4-epimerase
MPVPSKVLVTGGAGFIGSYVVDRLLAQGTDVVVFDHNAPGTLDPDLFRKGVELFQGDVRDDVAVTEAAAHVDGIIHLAAVLGTQETIKNPRPAAHTNILGSLNILEAANQYNLPVVYAGVGNYWMRDKGAGTYTISKTAVEDFIRMFNQFRDGRISVVRPVNAYGPRQSVAAPFGSSKVRKIMPSFICRALAGVPIEVYGDGTSVSDCVFVDDAANVFVSALTKLHFGDAPVTVGVGPFNSVKVLDIAELVAHIVSTTTGQPKVPIVHLPMRPGEVPNSVTDADTNSVRVVGVDPNTYTGLGPGIEKTVNWYIENGWGK